MIDAITENVRYEIYKLSARGAMGDEMRSKISSSIVSLIAFSYSTVAIAADSVPATSPFLQCDGSKGHANALEVLGQLVAITATAGLAGDAINPSEKDKDKKLSGQLGAQACDTAIAQESDPIRRTQLGLARTIHMLDAGNLHEALTSAKQVPQLAPNTARDWAYEISLGSSAKYLEASVLALLGRTQEAENTAIQSAALAPYDVYAINRVATFMRLTPTLEQNKLAYLEQLVRMRPETLNLRAELYAWIGNYDHAAKDLADEVDLIQPFFPNQEYASLWAMEAIYLHLAGQSKTAEDVAEKSRLSLARMIAKGAALNDKGDVAGADEKLAFYRILTLTSEGNLAKARIAFAARDRWLQIPPAALVPVLVKLRAGVTASDLGGALSVEPTKVRSDYLAANLAMLSQTLTTDSLTLRTSNIAKVGLYTRMSGAVWKVSPKPRMLVRNPPKEVKGFELIDAKIAGYGTLAAGEGVLLHAALLAKSRGQNGFVVRPGRSDTSWIGVRTGAIGTPGFPASATFSVDQTITALSPHIPPPQNSSQR